MKRILFVFTAILLSVTVFAHSDEEVEAVTGATVDEFGFNIVDVENFEFAWKVTNEQLIIRYGAETTGWVAVGFNATHVMRDANFILAKVEDGEGVVSDQFGTGLFAHDEDTNLGGTSDVELTFYDESDGWSRFEIVIPLNSGDEYDSVLAEGDEVEVLLAYSKKDSFSKKHKKHAEIDIEL